MKNNIRVERAIRRLTQQELADLTGVSRQTINAIETEKYTPSGVLLLKIVAIFKKPVEAAFSLEEADWD